MGKELIQILRTSPGRVFSGKKLSKELGISRQALWKQVEKLRKDGWVIDGVSGKGYTPRSVPLYLEYFDLKDYLTDPSRWDEIHILKSTGSTNSLLMDRRESGVTRAIAVSDTQTAGRGRMGRAWHSPPGRNIYMSMLLPLRLPPARSPSITLVAGLSVAVSIEHAAGVYLQVKWPNDLFGNGKKVVGILAEMVAELDETRSVVIGVGVNVNMKQEEFPGEISSSATSLRELAGKTLDRVPLAAMIAENLGDDLARFERAGLTPFLEEWGNRSYLRGKRVAIRIGKEWIEGEVAGVHSELGALLVRDDDGRDREILSGDIKVIGR
jgi:BirA family biotin operon repressor/biotin-[acetyl-CoA-carboxylase] ligase